MKRPRCGRLPPHAAAQMVQEVDSGDQALELAGFLDDRDQALLEDRQQVGERGGRRQRLEPAGHRPGDLVGEALVMAIDGEQHVGFVENADHLAVLDHRQLRDVVEPHPVVGDQQRVARRQGHGAALAVAPRLALPMLNVYFAAAGALMVATWRMMFHRQDPADPRHRKLKGQCLAIWQVNVLWFAATLPLLLSSMDAVPGSGRRDSVLGALSVYVMAAATRLRKAHYTSIWERPLLGLKDPDLKELTYARAKLWFCDRVSSFRADLIAEVGYFGVMSYLLFVAAWRWVSNDPSAATVDWLQVAVNLVALVLLILLWVRIKKMNEQLARDIEQEIRLRQFERGQG